MYDNLIISEQLKLIIQKVEETLSGNFSILSTQINNKVDKVAGKQLSTEDYTSAEKTKLSGIESGAQVNVQANWNETDALNDAYIQNKPSLSSYFNNVDYDSNTKRIYFKNNSTILGSIDTSDFVRDGMVTNAEIKTPSVGPNAGIPCLVITFNSDSQINPIEIPLTLIFNPDNYYTKDVTDAKFVEKEVGKGLSTNDYTNDHKSAVQALINNTAHYTNVQADWAESDSNSDSYIQNKPTTLAESGITDISLVNGTITIGNDTVTPLESEDITGKSDKIDTIKKVHYQNKAIYAKTVHEDESEMYLPTYPGVEVVNIATIKSDLNLTKADVGLGNVDNTSDTNKPISTATQSALDNKVDKVEGKALSTNDFTDEYKENLETLVANTEPGAQVNVIESVKVNGTPLTITNKSVDVTVPDVSGYFNAAEYDSQAKEIHFKHGNTVLATIDAEPFIKDGMISNVEIVDGYLVITFNEDAGGDTISIDLDDIFNPSNYYTKDYVYSKTEIDTNFVAKDGNKVLSDNNFTDADSEKLSGIASGAQVNVIESISKNGTALTIENKNINITVPTAVSELTNDSGYLTEHQDISGKANSADLAPVATSGNFNDLINKPGVTVARFQGVFVNYAALPSDGNSYGSGIPLDGDYCVIDNSADYGVGDKIGRWMFIYSGEWNIVGSSGWRPLFHINTLASVETDAQDIQTLIL